MEKKISIIEMHQQGFMSNRLKMSGYFLVMFILWSCNDGAKKLDYVSIRGSWRCEEHNPLSGTHVYLVDIDRSKSDTSVYLLSNFHNEDPTDFIFARLNKFTLTIAEQGMGDLIIRSGKGTVTNDYSSIDFTYTVYDGINEMEIKAFYTRPK